MNNLPSRPKPPKLLQQVRERIRTLHYSYRTEQVYVDWIRRFILFHDKRHPREMEEIEVEGFLTHLAVARRVSASTQNQALSALLFLYKKVLDIEIGWVEDVVRAKRPERVPVVLTREETVSLLDRLSGRYHLMASLMYGAGLRVMECMRLRIQDVDFGYRQITVRSGKGGKDRYVPLPESVIDPLQEQIRRGPSTTSFRPAGWFRGGFDAQCSGKEIPKCPIRTGMVVCVSFFEALG